MEPAEISDLPPGEFDLKITELRVYLPRFLTPEKDSKIFDWEKWYKFFPCCRSLYKGKKISPFWHTPDSFYELLRAYSKKIQDLMFYFDGGESRAAKKIAEAIENERSKSEDRFFDKTLAIKLLKTLRRNSSPSFDFKTISKVGKIEGYLYRSIKGYIIEETDKDLNANLPFVLEIWVKKAPSSTLELTFVNRSLLVDGMNDEKYDFLYSDEIFEFLSKSNFNAEIITNITAPYVPVKSKSKKIDLYNLVKVKDSKSKFFKDIFIDVYRMEVEAAVKKLKRMVSPHPFQENKKNLKGTEPGTPQHWLKNEAENLGKEISDLVVLSKMNDPYWIGGKTQVKKAKWFEQIYNKYYLDNYLPNKAKPHLRRIHYTILNLEKLPGGEIYRDEHWNYLLEASRFARILGLVPLDGLIERRSREPHEFLLVEDAKRDIRIKEESPHLIENLNSLLNLSMDDLFEPGFIIEGYQYSDFHQPYHIEVWAEKTTVDDILEPICKKLGVNLVTGFGYMSHSRIASLFERILKYQKPCILLYVSDFDEAGQNMPVQVSWLIYYYLNFLPYHINSEYPYIKKYQEELKRISEEFPIRLKPVVLTPDQIDRYNLPRVKSIEDENSDLKNASTRSKSKKNKPEKFKKGKVELDALVALYPGELEKIIENEINKYRDPLLPQKIKKTKLKVEKEIQKVVEEIKEQEFNGIKFKDYIKRLKQDSKESYEILLKQIEIFCKKIEDLKNNPIYKNFKKMQEERWDYLKQNLPPIPTSENDLSQEDWLFDSKRDFYEQILKLKEFKQ